MLQIFDVDN